MTRLYADIIEAKNGSPVPLFSNGHAMHSRYAPEKEAAGWASTINYASLFVIAGAGGGYFIAALKKRFPESVILVAEHSEEDIAFLSRIPAFYNLLNDRHVVIFPVKETKAMMQNYYLPAVYGALAVLETHSWQRENSDDIATFRTCVAEASRAISADYSVQSHFGKLWQRNIMLNLKQCGCQHVPAFPTEKTAFVAAAGPSLDNAISYVRQNSAALYVIATDTAYHSFAKRGIACDAVVSIDGQMISASHFHNAVHVENTLFIFDLCANSSAAQFINRLGGKIMFVQTGHPLAQYAAHFAERKTGTCFPIIETGAGTVTIAAFDVAFKAGFKKIVVAGADFAYSQKPYAKGTYLDALYNAQSMRTDTQETLFSRLMFRSALAETESGTKTTDTLASYKTTFESYAAQQCAVARDGKIYVCTAQKSAQTLTESAQFDFDAFATHFKNDFASAKDAVDAPQFPPVIATLFPAVAAYRMAHSNEPAAALLKLAYNDILRYI
ncbi:MAG: motility associated factor glycosyltransferase family protein [Treponema sp.]|nr:motility associated factor glycosyltransferase family protein [Treponema sp.]